MGLLRQVFKVDCSGHPELLRDLVTKHGNPQLAVEHHDRLVQKAQ
jgi:hypothetical protein